MHLLVPSFLLQAVRPFVRIGRILDWTDTTLGAGLIRCPMSVIFRKILLAHGQNHCLDWHYIGAGLIRCPVSVIFRKILLRHGQNHCLD